MFARISTPKFRKLCEKSFNNCCDRQVAKKIPFKSEQDSKKVVFGENLHEARDKSLFCGRKLCQKPFRNQNLSGLQFVWVLAENVVEESRKNSKIIRLLCLPQWLWGSNEGRKGCWKKIEFITLRLELKKLTPTQGFMQINASKVCASLWCKLLTQFFSIESHGKCGTKSSSEDRENSEEICKHYCV